MPNPFDHQKHPLVQGLNWFAEEKIAEAQSLLAKSLPASVVSVDSTGTIVTVKIEIESGYKFPTIKCPVYGPQYVRWPIQKGDRGVFLSADVYLGGMSGLGGGVASLGAVGNLGTGIWFPIGNTSFDPTDDPNKVVIYGPDGAIIRNKAKTCRVEVDKDGNVMIYGAKSISTDVGGYGSRTTHLGGSAWQIDNYTTGATVTTNNHPVHPPEIPPP